ncbi:lysine exporter LysO family protein [Pseudoflavonifractor phocaeensis]|uniref:lysine exporter LysO family protein n=1 Tax=Pseudoflavonifractor phocaeensis TaxID=1870988 RepID=UPI001FAEFB25|nr:lysine exporter LysO family protein [Pseudoflavonifractor phocaeensis]
MVKGWMGMGTTLSTLSNLAIYIALVVLGAFIGSRNAVRRHPLVWVGKLQFVALMILIVTLGVNLGANDEVISSLGQIGLAAFLITVLALFGSVLALTLLRRFVLKLDRFGLPRGATESARQGGSAGGKADNALTKWIIIAVVLGMLAGRFLLPPSVTAHCGTVINFGLYLLLFMVGMDMGKQGTFLSDIKTAGFQVLLVPVAVCVGTLAFAALAGLFLPLGVKDAMAASAGMGWYSLAPTLLAPYSALVSAIAFLSNVMREIFSILLIPLVAKHLGYVECAALPGAAAMDTVLPVVVGATHERITIYSFTSGVVLSLAVPILVPALVALPF